MKAFILCALLTISNAAIASADVCETRLPCGSFAGPYFDSLDADAIAVGSESVEVSALEDGSELLILSRADSEGKLEFTAQYRLVPQGEQAFELLQKKGDEWLHNGSGGNCRSGRCTYASNPDASADYFSWAGVFGFEGDQLTRSWIVQNAKGEAKFTIARMKRK